MLTNQEPSNPPVDREMYAELNTDEVKSAYLQFVRSLFKYMGGDENFNVMSKLHAAVGISGEAGELLDAVKKVWIYNKPENRVHLIEECGDILFYMTALMDMMQVSMTDLMCTNMIKLNKRYPSGYTDQAAQDRADKVDEGSGD